MVRFDQIYDSLNDELTTLRERIGEFEQQAEVQRQRINTIVASVPGIVWEAWGAPDAPTQRMDFVSDYVEPMLRYRIDEWLATPNFWLSIVHPDDQAQAGREAGEIFASGSGGSLQFRWVTRNGQVIWVEAHCVAICDADGAPVGMRGVTMDITDRKLADDERLRLQQEITRSKEQFAQMLVHDLKNPLTASIGYLDFLATTSLVETQQSLVDGALKSCATMKQQVEDILDLAQLEDHKLVLRRQITAIGELFSASAEELRSWADQEHKTIRIQVPEELPSLSLDSHLFERVISNLLSNAIKHTPPGTAITIGAALEGTDVCLWVRDTGPGIAPEIQATIFQHFIRHDLEEGGQRQRNSGLGLTFCKLAVEAHGGRIEVESPPDQGTTFVIRLPADAVLVMPASMIAPESGAPARRLEGEL